MTKKFAGPFFVKIVVMKKNSSFSSISFTIDYDSL